MYSLVSILDTGLESYRRNFIIPTIIYKQLLLISTPIPYFKELHPEDYRMGTHEGSIKYPE